MHRVRPVVADVPQELVPLKRRAHAVPVASRSYSDGDRPRPMRRKKHDDPESEGVDSGHGARRRCRVEAVGWTREVWLWLRADWKHVAKAFGVACGVAVLAVMALIIIAFFLELSQGVSARG